MKSMDLSWYSEDTVQFLTEILKQEKVVVGDSDTVIGLLANTTESGFRALDSIKKRENKPYIILIASQERLSDFVLVSPTLQIEKLLNQYWPGPLTVIFKARPDLPDYMKSSEGTIALRVPQHKGLLALLSSFRGLFSTSANLAGNPVPKNVTEIDQHILDKVACIVTDDKKEETVPSTIIDCSGKTIKIIREGAIKLKSVL